MKKPNLLFLYTDEQAVDTLSAYGNSRIEMPALNSLSRESSVFEHAYVTQPICTPSRSTLLTGLYPHSNGCVQNNIPLRPETPCFPELLGDREYTSAHFGKWHLGDEIFRQHGFDEWISIEDCYHPYYSAGKDRNRHSDYHNFLIDKGFRPSKDERFRRGETARLPEEFSKPIFLAEKTTDFIERNKNRPFALFVNFLEPHMPFYGPRDGQYKLDEVSLPSNFHNGPDENNPLKTRFLSHKYIQSGFDGIDLDSPDGWKKIRSNYWGLCSQVDSAIGRILEKLRSCGLYDDTIIVFTSDHGDMMGSHKLLGKCVMFEEAVRVPFFIKLRNQKEGRTINSPVSQIDTVPTLLDCMDKKIPPEMQGKSLKPILEKQSGVPENRDVFIEWNDPKKTTGNCEIPGQLKKKAPDCETLDKYLRSQIRTVITPDGWKYNWSSMGEDELYNLNEDRGETRNLASEASRKERIGGLREKIRAWQRETNDAAVL